MPNKQKSQPFSVYGSDFYTTDVIVTTKHCFIFHCPPPPNWNNENINHQVQELKVLRSHVFLIYDWRSYRKNKSKNRTIFLERFRYGILPCISKRTWKEH
jgi:hypothetical protein